LRLFDTLMIISFLCVCCTIWAN